MNFNGFDDFPYSPDHTTTVTGRGEDGWPKVSYHASNKRDVPRGDLTRLHVEETLAGEKPPPEFVLWPPDDAPELASGRTLVVFAGPRQGCAGT